MAQAERDNGLILVYAANDLLLFEGWARLHFDSGTGISPEWSDGGWSLTERRNDMIDIITDGAGR